MNPIRNMIPDFFCNASSTITVALALQLWLAGSHRFSFSGWEESSLNRAIPPNTE